MSINIKYFKIRQISKEKNKKVNALANLTLAFDFISDRSVPLEFLPNPGIDIAKIVCQTVTDQMWMDDIIAYLKDGKLPSNKLEAQRIQCRPAKFCLFH